MLHLHGTLSCFVLAEAHLLLRVAGTWQGCDFCTCRGFLYRRSEAACMLNLPVGNSERLVPCSKAECGVYVRVLPLAAT